MTSEVATYDQNRLGNKVAVPKFKVKKIGRPHNTRSGQKGGTVAKATAQMRKHGMPN